MHCCAACGIAGVDDIKLKDCNDCDLVKYCSDDCQKDHRPKHEEDCRRRAAELKDEILFKQPESTHLGDCPLCCLPLPIDPNKFGLYCCCCKRLCVGCMYANTKREAEQRGFLLPTCPFCRETMSKTDEEENERLVKRVNANDPVAICKMGTNKHYEGDYTAAFEYWTKAAALGDVNAHYQLSTLYFDGKGVEKDEEKELHHLKEASIGGHAEARHNLGCVEKKNGRMDRAAKHWIIAAKLGKDESLTNVKVLYQHGLVSKDDFAAALRGYQAAIAATKSPQREQFCYKA